MTDADNEFRLHPPRAALSQRRDGRAVHDQTGQPIAQGAPLGIFQGEEGSDSVAQPFHALAGKQGHLGTALGTAPLVALGQRAGVEGQGA